MDFATLKSRILAVIGRAPADICYELTTADINRDLRLRTMETTATSAEAASITLPTDFAEVIDVYRDSSPRTILRPTSTLSLSADYPLSTGVPSEYAISGTTLLLSPSPSGTTNIKIRYYAKLTDLSADSDTNTVLTRFPDVYLYGSLSHHSVLIRDEKAAMMWTAKYQEAVRKANASDASSRYAAGFKVAVPYHA